MTTKPEAVPSKQNLIKFDATTGLFQIARSPGARGWEFPARYLAEGEGSQSAYMGIGGFQVPLKQGIQTITGVGSLVELYWDHGTAPASYFHFAANPFSKTSVYDEWPVAVQFQPTQKSVAFSFDGASKGPASWTLDIYLTRSAPAPASQFALLVNGAATQQLSAGPHHLKIDAAESVGLGVTNLLGEVKVVYTLTELV